MLVAERTRLGEVIDKWLQRLRVTKAHVARFGGVSPNTLNYISQGTTTSPEMETLRKIARGLATDPFTSAVDQAAYADAWRELAVAAGLPEPSADIAPPDLESMFRSVGHDRQEAAFWADIARRYPNATPDQKRMLKELARAVFGSDGIARLGE